MNKFETEINGFAYYEEGNREEYLKELGESVHKYINTGVKNQQLDELLTLQVEFRRRYQDCFNVAKVIEAAVEETKGSLGKKNKYISAEFGTISNAEIHESVSDFYNEACDKKELQNEIFDNLRKNIQNSVLSILKDVAYLSHVNMLYELYEREQKLRQEQKEYEEISKKYQKIAEITKMLSEKKKMELNELERQLNISEDEVLNTLSRNSQMFNIRNKKNVVKVSLSPKGKKFNNYFLNSSRNISNETYNELLYKNCNMLIESLENSCERKVVYQIKLEGVKPEALRAIEFKYYRTASKLIADKEDMYTVNRMDLEEKKERVSSTGETVIYKIPRE